MFQGKRVGWLWQNLYLGAPPLTLQGVGTQLGSDLKMAWDNELSHSIPHPTPSLVNLLFPFIFISHTAQTKKVKNQNNKMPKNRVLNLACLLWSKLIYFT